MENLLRFVAWLPRGLVTSLPGYLAASETGHLTFNHKTPSSQAGTRARTPAVPPWFPPNGRALGRARPGKAYARAPITAGETGAPTGGLRPVRFAAPEGFSACCCRPASTIPGSLEALHKPTRLHQHLWLLCPNYAIRKGMGQPSAWAKTPHTAPSKMPWC